jgi:serine/threonine-protein kinase
MGTPTYMSPEQCLAQGALSDRSDVYSLGVMLFEMLAGQPPFGGAGQAPLATIMQHVQGTPPLLRQRLPSAPAPVEARVGEMLSRAPERRPAMAQVVERIRLLEDGDPGVSPSAATPKAPRAPSLPGHAPASADELAQAVGRLPTLAAPTVQRDPPVSSARVDPGETDQAEALLPTLSVPAVGAAVSPPPGLPDSRSPAARRRLLVAILVGLLLGGGAVAVALFLHLF